jgi:uncharacterized membrane protein YobD (UPF0266 family)
MIYLQVVNITLKENTPQHLLEITNSEAVLVVYILHLKTGDQILKRKKGHVFMRLYVRRSTVTNSNKDRATACLTLTFRQSHLNFARGKLRYRMLFEGI